MPKCGNCGKKYRVCDSDAGTYLEYAGSKECAGQIDRQIDRYEKIASKNVKLQRLIVKNFESWENQTFDFDPGVNIFVGLSDAGKSSVLRAIRLVMENKPAGDRYRSDFAGKKAVTECTLYFADGISVSRIRSNSENKYLLTKDGETQTFEAFNTGVPDEIAEAINLTSTNLQRQIELPFLLAQNPPDRGRFFNEIAGLDKIDSSQKYANSKVLEQGREVTACEKEIKRIDAELEELDFIPDLEKKIKEIAALQNQKDELETKIKSITLIHRKYKLTSKELEKAEKVDTAKLTKKIRSTLELIGEYRKQKERLQKIKVIWTEYKQASAELSDLNNVDFAGLSKKIKLALQYIADYREKRRDLSRIKRSFEDYKLIQGELRNTEKTLLSESKKFNEARPDICPLCKREGWKRS